MAMLQLLPSGKLLRVASGKLAVQCCCAATQECQLSELEANFTWQQTCDVPCCFTFSDSSVADPDCEIVEWLWTFGDGSTSDEQNPTHCYEGSSEGDDWSVTLRVTDSCGCQSAKTYTVECYPCHDCEGGPCGEGDCVGDICNDLCFEDSLPDEVQVTISGAAGLLCNPVNGTYTLAKVPGSCLWTLDILVGGFVRHVSVDLICSPSPTITAGISWTQAGTFRGFSLRKSFPNSLGLGIVGADCSSFSAAMMTPDDLLTCNCSAFGPTDPVCLAITMNITAL